MKEWREIAIMVLIFIGISALLFYWFAGNRPAVYVVAFSESIPAVAVDLPVGYVAHLWVENGEPWAAITLKQKILDEWHLEVGEREGTSNGWKESWVIWVDRLEFDGTHCLARFRFKDIHYA